MAQLPINRLFAPEWLPDELATIAGECVKSGNDRPRVLVFETVNGPIEVIPFTLEEIDSVIVKLNALRAEQHNLPAFLKPQAD